MPALSLINCREWVFISFASSVLILDRKELVEGSSDLPSSVILGEICHEDHQKFLSYLA